MTYTIIALISILSTLWLAMLWHESKKIKEPYFYRTSDRSFGHTMGFSELDSVNITFGADSEELHVLLKKMADNVEEETFKRATNIHVEGKDAYAYSFTGFLNNPVCQNFKPDKEQSND